MGAGAVVSAVWRGVECTGGGGGGAAAVGRGGVDWAFSTRKRGEVDAGVAPAMGMEERRGEEAGLVV